MASTPLLSPELAELAKLVRESDSIELKVTVPEDSHRSAVRALGADPLEAQIRQVFFFDTPDLQLQDAGVVVRARRVQGRDSDTVVKLRPVVPSELPSEVRNAPTFGVEVDVLPGGFVCSGSFKAMVAPTVVQETVRGERPLRKLFSKEQRAFFAAHAPAGLTLDELAVLGPIFVLKLKLPQGSFGRKLVGEMWLYPDGSRIVELSTKCLPGQGIQTALALGQYLDELGIDVRGEQRTKTKTALEFFSNELRG